MFTNGNIVVLKECPYNPKCTDVSTADTFHIESCDKTNAQAKPASFSANYANEKGLPFSPNELTLIQTSRELILPDTSLCMIVRDELMNPAGGLELFLKCHAQFFDEVVIVDTGSKDGTREFLEEAVSKFSNLKVLDQKWQGYANARNHSIEKATQKYVLNLDADELIEPKDFENLKIIMPETNSKYYKFCFLDINPSEIVKSAGWNPRLFEKGTAELANAVWETAILFSERSQLVDLTATIKHFRPADTGVRLKHKNWYSLCERHIFNKAPSEVADFNRWKAFNLKRKEFYPFTSA